MRVLSLSGGGYQALYTASLLAIAEERHGPLTESFDLVVGTSAGAMIAAGVATGTPMALVRDVMISEGPGIFSARPAPVGAAAMARDVARYVKGAKYDGKRLSALVRAFSQDRVMSDAQSHLVVTAVRMRDAEPRLFSDTTDPGLPIHQAVMASAAAPMILPAQRVEGDLYADGALFANTPDMVALSHAVNVLGASPANVRMISVGAMNLCPPLSEPEDPAMGIMGWLRDNRIFRSTIAAQARHVEEMCRSFLGKRYDRIDASRTFSGRNLVGLDVASPEAIAASKSAAEASGPHLLRAMRDVIRSEPLPDRPQGPSDESPSP